MRAVQTDTYHTFVHAHQCKVNSQSRTSCKKCRLSKCLAAGMKISYVKTQEENCQKIVQCQKMKKVVFTHNDFPESERRAMLQLHDAQWEHSCNVIFKCYKNNPHAFLIQTCQTPPPQGLNTDHFLQFMEYVDISIYYGIIYLICKEDETLEDLNMLMRNNMAKISILYRALLFMVIIIISISFVAYFKIFNLQENWADSYIDYGRKMRPHSYDINELMLLQDQYGRKTVRFEYDKFFTSPWAANAGIEEEHRRLYMVS